MKAFSLLTFLATAALSVLALPATPLDSAVQYQGVKVLRVPVGEDTAPIDQLISTLSLERWTVHSTPNSHVDVEVPQDKYDEFVSAVDKISAESNITQDIVVMHEDLAQSIKEESEGSFEPKLDRRAGLANQAWFTNYHPYADHIQFLTDLAATFPANSKVVTSGTSLQGRTITGINIFGSSGSGTKPAVVVHGTVHAREWISTMVTESLAFNLLTNATAGVAEVKAYLEKYDFYFFPVVNPDGFVYTQTTTRTWRKNRSAPPSGSTCYGTDINRNWAHFAWSQSGGASTSPCAEDYKGTAQESAPETKGLASFLRDRAAATGVKLYLDVHSYSQLFLYPYGYSCTTQASNAADLQSISTGYAAAIRAPYGTRYTYGPACSTIYKTTADSTDYTYDNLGVKYSFTAELRDTGNYGFILPANQIVPSSIENWAGFKYLLANMK